MFLKLNWHNEALNGLSGFSNLEIIYYFDQVNPEKIFFLAIRMSAQLSIGRHFWPAQKNIGLTQYAFALYRCGYEKSLLSFIFTTMFRSPTILGNDLKFPPPEMADDEGMVAIGGDLSPDRLLAAYKQGIFPWYEGDIPVWWNPDPRFVLFPENIKISHSMKPILKKGVFQFTKNQCFEAVIRSCMDIPRHGQDGTWINEDVISAYGKLHKTGYVHSFEAWQNNTLVGGFYGMRLGRVFFGESMFSKVPNSSKAVFIASVLQMQEEGIELIDSQVYTPHLESLGAGMITRRNFLDLLKKLIPDG